MKYAVIGATGATGQLVIDEALSRGHEVVAYARNPRALTPRHSLHIVKGELTDGAGLRAAFEDVDAVLCCLGTHDKKNIDLMQKSLPLVIEAMGKAKRLILLSAFGVGDTAARASWLARLAYKLVVRSVYDDKRRSEMLLLASDLDWTIVQPVILTDEGFSDAVEARPMAQVKIVRGLPKVSRANVAQVMVEACESSALVGQRILVAPRASVI